MSLSPSRVRVIRVRFFVVFVAQPVGRSARPSYGAGSGEVSGKLIFLNRFRREWLLVTKKGVLAFRGPAVFCQLHGLIDLIGWDIAWLTLFDGIIVKDVQPGDELCYR